LLFVSDVGLATAAGCQLVASCDIAVASEKASFATPGYCAVDELLFLSSVIASELSYIM